MGIFDDLISKYGSLSRANLTGGGEPEAALVEPVTNLVRAFGEEVLNARVLMHAEVREDKGAVRPDFGVRVNGLMVGHVELKKPGTSLDPSIYGRTTHNARQWKRLANLPNLLHTNGTEWRLWRYGELVGAPVFLHTNDLAVHKGLLTAPPSLASMFSDFLNWKPSPITNVGRLVDVIAPLAIVLREEVIEAIKSDRRQAQVTGKDPNIFPFIALKKDWRVVLYPNATDSEFADGFAQTVVFALVIALSEGLSLEGLKVSEVADTLKAKHTLLGRALDLLTEHISQSSVGQAVEIIVRALSSAEWGVISQGRQDVYLHLYEHFLTSYDPEKRRQSGSYYTPVEVVDAMTRLTDEALRTYLGVNEGLSSENVAVLDPAMGTGTYPLSVLRQVANSATPYGAGAVSDAVTSAAARLYGIELQSGPFSVAELRLTQAVRDFGGEVPDTGLNLYVADTLEDPHSGTPSQLSYTLQLIAQQRQAANKMKLETPIQVCIGNPPYKDKSEGAGGWIEKGNAQTGIVPLDDFRLPDNGKYEYVLKNLYVYFWRWAMWKVFESIPGNTHGIVCFITATGYLNGPGFKGMREWIRRNTSRGWIINLTPEGKQPPTNTAVFNIETPVAIALFIRDAVNDTDQPAQIKYTELHGLRNEKFALLNELHLDDSEFIDTGSEWTDGFVPASSADWASFPALNDLFPWVAPGIKPNKTWVYNPSAEILEERWNNLVLESDPKTKSAKFKETRDSTLDKTKKPLHGGDTEQATNVPFRSVKWPAKPKIVQVGFRSFDRQYLIADHRLLHMPSPDLWAARSDSQIYIVEQHAHFPGAGPGLMFSALIPDMHFFNGRGGRALPAFHPDGTDNVAIGLVEALSRILAETVTSTDLISYVAAISAHPSYVERFADDLKHTGNRIPITTNSDLWKRAVRIGQNVIWCHTFGTRGTPPVGVSDILHAPSGYSMPVHDASVRSDIPDDVSYDLHTRTLHLGKGSWSNVDPRVWEYTVGGQQIIRSWVGYRRRKPKGKSSGPLSDIISTHWSTQWSRELSEVLAVLTHLINLEAEQSALLDSVLAGKLTPRDELRKAGVTWPATPKDRKPRKSGALF